MAVEIPGELPGLLRLDAVKESITTGHPIEPVHVPQVVRESIHGHLTNRDRRMWKRAWPGLKALAQQELGQ